MKKFLLNITILVLLFLGVILLILGWRMCCAEDIARSRFSLTDEQCVVVVGDSHAECSFVETNFIKMLTFHSTPLNISLMRLYELKCRSDISKIKVIVANLCYTTCGEWGVKEQVESSWRMLPYSFNHLDLIPIGKFDLFPEWLLLSLQQTPPIATDPSQRIYEASIDKRGSEWTLDATMQALNRHFGWKDKHSAQVQNSESAFCNTIECFKDFCDKNDIKLVMYSAPLSEGYQMRVPQWGRDDLKKWIAFIKKRGILYYDYMNSCPSSYFRDGDHLSKHGAELFTKKFYNEVLSPMLE